jgi:Cof subfamily protein (haloacid dehalogenase superfamily)
MNTRIKLIVSDVDGTLISKTHEITPATHRALCALQEAGIHVVLASSRPQRGMEHFLEASPVLRSTAVISMNGALITKADGVLLASHVLEPYIVHALYETVFDLLSPEGFNVFLLDEHDWWSSGYDELVKKEARSLRFEPHWQDLTKRIHSGKPMNKITILGEPERVAEAKRRIDAVLGDKVSASSPANPKFLDITAAGVHKGAAVKQLAAYLGLQREEICAIGDGENDVDMFRAVGNEGVSIAMGHASESVKSAARFVTGSHREDGWAQAIERFVLGTTHTTTK